MGRFYRRQAIGEVPAVSSTEQNTASFLRNLHPYDSLSEERFTEVLRALKPVEIKANEAVYQQGQQVEGLFIITSGAVDITLGSGALLSSLLAKNSFGERGLLRGGVAPNTATARTDTSLLMLPSALFQQLFASDEVFRNFFTRKRSYQMTGEVNTLASRPVSDLMTEKIISCAPGTSIKDAATLMKAHDISSILVTDGPALIGILTFKDIARKVAANGLSTDTQVSEIMTKDLISLPPTAIGSDVLHLMIEKGIGHVPIVNGDRLEGIITQTDLTRFQLLNSSILLGDISKCNEIAALATATARIPQLLANLVGAGTRHDVVTRLITDIADAVTRRLLKLAEQKLGPAPCPYLWLACGSQGRQEQTGVSDQDNCLFLDDRVGPADMAYFKELARFVSDGLHECGYVYCPGDMMATNDRWCQPVSIWRGYFNNWIESPVKEAQMLASVMFDLRPIGGDFSLFENLQQETLQKAASNSIFLAHMISNSVGHTPPLSLIGGITTLRSGEHKNHIDMKHNGVIPVVDLGRIYALQGQITAVNTRARLTAAHQAGTISHSGGQDLLESYDLLAETRLQHQARQIKQGEPPDNFMRPSMLSQFERSHLRDAFVVVRTMQAALTQGRAIP